MTFELALRTPPRGYRSHSNAVKTNNNDGYEREWYDVFIDHENQFFEKAPTPEDPRKKEKTLPTRISPKAVLA